MKPLNFIFTIIISSLILTSCEQKHNLVAQIDGIKNDTILVQYGTISDFYSGNRPKQDTVYAQNGKFIYNIPSQEPYFVYFYPKSSAFTKSNGSPYYAPQNYIETLIEPNDKINITGKSNKYYVDYKATGSEFNQVYSNLRSSYIEQSSKGAVLELKIDSLFSINNYTSSKRIMKLAKERNSFNRLYRKTELKYIKDNPKKSISAFFLTRKNKRNFELYYSTLPIEVKNGIFKFGLNSRVERFNRANKKNEAKSKISKGKPAPNFTLKSISGKAIELNSISKKYIVLDFWGSWCGYCIKGIPKMKEYYSKYKDKVEFIGIACKDTDIKWREAIKKHKLDWIQLFNTKELKNDVSINYGIKGYPTKIILDREKNIVEIFTDESDEFYTALDKLLQ
jgi:thiol-disulfide isomerase/thioredoxin